MEAAFPLPSFQGPNTVEWGSPGLTIREHFAGLAMQGWLANKDRPQHFLPTDDMAYCVKIADALIQELGKVQS